MNQPPKLAVDNTHAFPGKRGKTTGNEPPGNDEMEQRVARLEEAFVRVDANLDRLTSDMTAVKVSQAKIEERMDRVMDKAREMPTEAKINSLLNHKLTLLGIIIAAVLALAQWLPSAG